MTTLKCPGSSGIIKPKPEYVKCPDCGSDIEIWSDEFKGECPNCKKKVFKEEAPSCIEWCRHAKECVGGDKYEKYMKNKKIFEDAEKEE